MLYKIKLVISPRMWFIIEDAPLCVAR
ncbi:uncharacterized protein METZ01_LOCUS475129 [marine metagenome]|uniref:Uncharacterized protein n=1 Tax=marine metagenome TaxID=408172 RepID=A0A383BSI4_9ZZZZ